MVVKIITQNVRLYESTIFCIFSDPAPLKIHDLQGSCWIAVVNRNSVGSGDSGDAVPSNRDSANPFQTVRKKWADLVAIMTTAAAAPFITNDESYGNVDDDFRISQQHHISQQQYQLRISQRQHQLYISQRQWHQLRITAASTIANFAS